MLFTVLSLEEASLILHFLICIPTAATDAAAGNSNGIKKLLANAISTFFIKGNQIFLMIQEACLEIPLTVSSSMVEFWIILYLLINYLQRIDEALNLGYQLMITYVENYCRH